MDMSLTSPAIGLITEALAKAQGSMDKAIKDSKNPHFKSSYADISSVIDASQKHLSENGIAFTSSVVGMGEHIILVGTLSHSSGEWIRTFIPLIMNKNDMQSLGSCVSYARRYALSALCNIAQADDDGNAISQPIADPINKASDKQVGFISSLIKKVGDEDLVKTLCDFYKVTVLSDISSKDAAKVIERLQNKIDEKMRAKEEHV